MLNNCDKALACLSEATDLTESKADTLVSVETLVNSQTLSEKLSYETILQMNTAAALFCQGNTIAAKDQLENLMDRLELKVLTNNHDSKTILPAYLVNILTYLLLKTSKSSQPANYFQCRELQGSQKPGQVQAIFARGGRERAEGAQFDGQDVYMILL